MSNKYICIKKYPGGPDVGQILVRKIDFKNDYHVADFDPRKFPQYFELIIDDEVKYSLKDIKNAVESFDYGAFSFSDLADALNK